MAWFGYAQSCVTWNSRHRSDAMTEPSGHGSWELHADPPGLLEGVASVAYRTALFALAVGGAAIKCARGRR